MTAPGPDFQRRKLVVWLVADDRTGHRSQLEGLHRALARGADVDARWIAPLPRGKALWACLTRRFPATGSDALLPTPDLVVGCGHATHLTVLAAKRAFPSARSVVLMKPSLPPGWFDLCVIPQHDFAGNSPGPEISARENIFITRGVLNTARASVHQKPTQGLFLVGGPSKHHGWDEKTLLTQIRQVVKETPGMRWALTTSRRTPPATAEALLALRRVGVEVIPLEKTDAGWVVDAIAVSSQVWVTEDSVSMIYESLTSGSATGLLWVPRTDRDRVTDGVDRLVQDGLVTPFLEWTKTHVLVKQETPINEADRVARRVLAWQDV